MSSFYDDMAATVAEMLSPNADPPGGTVHLLNTIPGVYDPATSTTSPSTPVDTPRSGMVFDFGPGQVNGPGGLIQGGDKRCLMEVGVVPGLEDRIITAGAVEYVIKGIGTLDPSGTNPVLYDIHLRT